MFCKNSLLGKEKEKCLLAFCLPSLAGQICPGVINPRCCPHSGTQPTASSEHMVGISLGGNSPELFLWACSCISHWERKWKIHDQLRDPPFDVEACCRDQMTLWGRRSHRPHAVTLKHSPPVSRRLQERHLSQQAVVAPCGHLDFSLMVRPAADRRCRDQVQRGLSSETGPQPCPQARPLHRLRGGTAPCCWSPDVSRPSFVPFTPATPLSSSFSKASVLMLSVRVNCDSCWDVALPPPPLPAPLPLLARGFQKSRRGPQASALSPGYPGRH
ncbi:uncharacterized protein LOC116664764 isoform X1 [Camelus ferus]|uniref:Uncharacterized protein LOC116664764 isoform X1 n=1 Tax=Camelus ferus TaxID=419612 RepID=A0A8B8T9J9_CAMFR|nr:uncharacterized protein LOC116664764 isoform X1 [Camelus ferus]